MPQSDMESSSGLIMSLIRIVKNSKDDAERDVIKKKLEDFLALSDEKLTKLVATHQEELKVVVENCTVIPTNLENSIKKLASVKQKLTTCREMLTSKLNDLVKLSEESEKNEKILVLLDQVSDLSNVPTRINESLNNEEYFEATKLLKEKQDYMSENFDSFDCLKDLKSELDNKRDEMYRLFMEKLLIVDETTTLRDEIVESLKLMKMIDKTPELADPEIAKENVGETVLPAKPSLFKFSLSSHAICFNEHYREQVEVTKTLLS